MLYGHRRNPEGYYECLREFDEKLHVLVNNLNDNDMLIITADHGNDPTHTGTDHTREHVPLLVYNRGLQSRDLGIRKSFTDVAATISEIFGIKGTGNGESFLS